MDANLTDSERTFYSDQPIERESELFEAPFNLAGESQSSDLTPEGHTRAKAEADAIARKAQLTFPEIETALAIHQRQDVLEACKFATGIAALNKGRRFAYSDNGAAVAVLEDGSWKACFEKVITGQWVYGGLNVARNWIELV